MTGKNSPRVKQLLKTRYDRLKERGLCVCCAVRPANDSTIRCDQCNEQRKKSNLKTRINKIKRTATKASVTSQLQFSQGTILFPEN